MQEKCSAATRLHMHKPMQRQTSEQEQEQLLVLSAVFAVIKFTCTEGGSSLDHARCS
jgi:hypothetical protein